MELNQKQRETRDKVEFVSRLLGVEPAWADAVAMVESSLGLHQVSKTGCAGVFQMSTIAMKDLMQAMKNNDDDMIDIMCGRAVSCGLSLIKRHKSIERRRNISVILHQVSKTGCAGVFQMSTLP